MVVVRVVSELFFSSKISEACRTLGINCVVAKSTERLNQMLSENPDAIVFVDLGLAGGEGASLAGLAVTSVGAERVWAFYSHVAHELLEAAQSAGVTQALPRSRFFEMLPDILQSSSQAA